MSDLLAAFFELILELLFCGWNDSKTGSCEDQASRRRRKAWRLALFILILAICILILAFFLRA